MTDMVTYVRPSGSTMELADTPNMAQFAKDNGWKRKGAKEKEVKKEITKPVSKKKSPKKAK